MNSWVACIFFSKVGVYVWIRYSAKKENLGIGNVHEYVEPQRYCVLHGYLTHFKVFMLCWCSQNVNYLVYLFVFMLYNLFPFSYLACLPIGVVLPIPQDAMHIFYQHFNLFHSKFFYFLFFNPVWRIKLD